MTDEEMAEEYADNISGLELTCSLLAAKDKNHAYRLGRYDGFLAGLKAGKDMAEADLATVAYMQGADNQKKKAEKQLTKARDLLNEFMRISKASDEDFEHDYSELIGEADQFLKEVSE